MEKLNWKEEGMARAEWGQNGRGKGCCTYKRTTLIVCCINILIALYVLHSLYASSLYLFPSYPTPPTFGYSEDQQRKMDEANQIRKESEPVQLIKLVTQLEKDILREERVVQLPKQLKRKLVNEILSRLRSLDAAANATVQREAVESWREQKLKEAKKLLRGKQRLNSTVLPEEAGVIVRALSSSWAKLSEEIGIWIPIEIVHNERDDKPEGEEEFDSEILPGRTLPLECRAELHTDYDGAAVRWGLTHHKETAYDCCMACLDQAKHAKPGEKRCNIWVYCPSETGCYSPDIYEHKNQECWLKYSEAPKLNFKDQYSESYRSAHPNAPLIVPWVSGIVSV